MLVLYIGIFVKYSKYLPTVFFVISSVAFASQERRVSDVDPRAARMFFGDMTTKIEGLDDKIVVSGLCLVDSSATDHPFSLQQNSFDFWLMKNTGDNTEDHPWVVENALSSVVGDGPVEAKDYWARKILQHYLMGFGHLVPVDGTEKKPVEAGYISVGRVVGGHAVFIFKDYSVPFSGHNLIGQTILRSPTKRLVGDELSEAISFSNFALQKTKQVKSKSPALGWGRWILEEQKTRLDSWRGVQEKPVERVTLDQPFNSAIAWGLVILQEICRCGHRDDDPVDAGESKKEV